MDPVYFQCIPRRKYREKMLCTFSIAHEGRGCLADIATRPRTLGLELNYETHPIPVCV